MANSHGLTRRGLHERVDDLSYPTIFLLWVCNILLFSIIYLALDHIPGNGPISSITGAPVEGSLNMMYYSVITATGTGYGDIVPVGYSRVFAAIQSFSGLLLLAVFVSKLLSRRQDVALRKVHEISFQTALHNMREDLYVARKDLDMGIAAAESRHRLSESERAQLTVAFQQIAHLLQEIPDYYADEFYAIDPRRETLLIEAVERTLMRILRLAEALAHEHIVPREDTEAGAELHHMWSSAHDSLVTWEKYAGTHDPQAFQRMRDTWGKIHALTHS